MLFVCKFNNVNIIHVKLYYFEQGDAYIFDRSRYVAAYLMRGSMPGGSHFAISV